MRSAFYRFSRASSTAAARYTALEYARRHFCFNGKAASATHELYRGLLVPYAKSSQLPCSTPAELGEERMGACKRGAAISFMRKRFRPRNRHQYVDLLIRAFLGRNVWSKESFVVEL